MQQGSLRLLTLIRSFSFCHFSASSSISMIFSCSCSFCSDSSVCGEMWGLKLSGAGGEGNRTRERPRRVTHQKSRFNTHPHSPSLSKWYQCPRSAGLCASGQESSNASNTILLYSWTTRAERLGRVLIGTKPPRSFPPSEGREALAPFRGPGAMGEREDLHSSQSRRALPGSGLQQ